MSDKRGVVRYPEGRPGASNARTAPANGLSEIALESDAGEGGRPVAVTVGANSPGSSTPVPSVTRPRLLDLFCGGGGASMGYWLAGFEVVGVDIAKRGRYPFAHFQADALEFVPAYGCYFDAIHASPPCQAYSRLAARHPEREYPDLVEPTRRALQATGKPYVIENVPEAPLLSPVVLCGSSFVLGTDEYQLRRHRAFETNWPLMAPACAHDERPVISVAGHAGRAGRNLSGSTAQRRQAMQIPWLSSDAIAEAIPPDYAEHIGWQLRNHLEALADAA